MEPGYPRPLASEFPGLTGNISAALAVPASRSRPEMVYFFKDGEDHSKTHRGRIQGQDVQCVTISTIKVDFSSMFHCETGSCNSNGHGQICHLMATGSNHHIIKKMSHHLHFI